MTWLFATIISYFFLAIVALFDRYLLIGPIKNPKIYTFYVGALWGILPLIFIPFGVIFPGINTVFLGLAAGLIRIFAILFLAKSISEIEISRVIPAIGGFLPIFSFLLFFFYFPQARILTIWQVIAFLLLVSGSVLISLKGLAKKYFTFKDLKYPTISAFLFALSFFLAKKVFLETDFLSGFLLILLGGGLGAVFFLISSRFRKEIFTQKISPKIPGLFLSGQVCGGLGVVFQQYAVFSAKASQVPLINALEGIRYVFLLIFTVLISLKFPQILREEISRKILFQKIFAILLIGAGLGILFFK